MSRWTQTAEPCAAPALDAGHPLLAREVRWTLVRWVDARTGRVVYVTRGEWG